MVFGVYVIRDVRSTFMSPMVDVNDSVAVRNFEHALMQTESLYHTHKDDFELYKVGTYDNETGFITPYDVRELVAEGRSF